MHGQSGHGTKSTLKVFGNIFISFIGAGVLGLPYAFKEAGILEGIIIMCAVGLLSVRAMLLVIDSKDRILSLKTSNDLVLSPRKEESKESLLQNGDIEKSERQKSKDFNADGKSKDLGYGDVGHTAFGKLGGLLVDVAIVVSQTGFCCAYLIFISENIAQYFSLHNDLPEDAEPGSNTQKIVLLCLLIPLCLLCLLRHLHKLAIFSLFADFANVFAYTIVFWFDFEHAGKVRMHPKEIDLSGFPFFAGIAIYCYEGAGMVLSLESSMAKEVRYRFRSIFKWTMLLITTLYVLFGVCGYMSFGPETNPIITLNLPSGLFPFLVKSCLCFSLFFTFPVMMFPVIQILEKRWNFFEAEKWKGNVLRFMMVLLSAVIVLIIPSFADLMSLVGATCCSLLAFILPASFHLKLFNRELTISQKIMDVSLILVGLVGTIIGTVDSLKRLGVIQSPVDLVNGTTST